MNYYKITLVPLSAFGTPVRADTLFGHLCWAMRYREGEKALTDFLDRQAESPRLLLSDGFLGDELPRPVLPPAPYEKGATLEEARARKRRDKIAHVPMDRLEAIRDRLSSSALDGALQGLADRGKNGGRPEPPRQIETVRARVRINRWIDGAEDGGLFQLGETFHRPGTRIAVYAAMDGLEPDALRGWLDDTARSGYGRGAGAGMGAFDIEGFEPVAPLVRDTDTRLMTLSACVPSEDDSTDALYEILVKRGRLGGLYARGMPPEIPTARKSPLLTLAPGATFARTGGRVYTGRMVNAYAPNPAILDYAYALCWGFKPDGREAAA